MHWMAAGGLRDLADNTTTTIIALLSLILPVLALAGPAAAQDTKKNDVKGLFLLTDYPAVSLRPGQTSTINLRLQNYAMPPERLALSVAGVPQGWTAKAEVSVKPDKLAKVLPGSDQLTDTQQFASVLLEDQWTNIFFNRVCLLSPFELHKNCLCFTIIPD